MSNLHGDFVWYELLSPDAAASAAFYSSLLGWQVREDPEYREITASDGMIGGILQLTPEMTAGGARPAWLGYLQVDDVDRMIASIRQGGGTLLMPARDMPTVGRFALVADPQGAPFYVITPAATASASEQTSHAFSYDRPRLGHCAWNELATSDPEAAIGFYAERFGWAKNGGMDIPGLGRYDFLRHTGRAPDGSPPMQGILGAVMPRMPQMPVSAWTFYFRVADVDAALDYVRNNGGTIVIEPMEIPGGEFSMNALDPQGAAFALVGPRRR